MSASTASFTTDINVRYEKLVQEHTKLRAQSKVLREGVLAERSKNVELIEQIRNLETSTRKLMRENESFQFRNEQLSKRVEYLQEELEKKDTKVDKSNKKIPRDVLNQLETLRSRVMLLEEELRNNLEQKMALTKQLDEIERLHSEEIEAVSLNFAEKLKYERETLEQEWAQKLAALPKVKEPAKKVVETKADSEQALERVLQETSGEVTSDHSSSRQYSSNPKSLNLQNDNSKESQRSTEINNLFSTPSSPKMNGECKEVKKEESDTHQADESVDLKRDGVSCQISVLLEKICKLELEREMHLVDISLLNKRLENANAGGDKEMFDTHKVMAFEAFNERLKALHDELVLNQCMTKYYENEVVTIVRRNNIVKEDLQEMEQLVREKESRVVKLTEELSSTHRGYQSQLTQLTEHIAELNARLVNQTEQNQELNRQGSQRGRDVEKDKERKGLKSLFKSS